ncbi:MAG: phytanoyl-CoA dioxygenase family protein [bacterium]|nr:phytanoyl-CoA dioxygenase family protein [bacterium]
MATLSQLVDRVSGGRVTKRDFEARIDRYIADGRRVDGDGESLVDAFLKSGGAWLSEASERIAQSQPTYDFDRATDVLGLWHEPGSFDRALAQLRKDGYAILDVRVPDATVAELSGYFAGAPCTLTSDSGSSLSEGETVRVDFDSPLAEKYAVTTDAVLQNATVRALLLDRGLLQIAQAYCGSAPIVDIVTAWYSFPSAQASHEAAQLYHFDLDRVRWLKAFLLLTDQDEETGAHMYVPGTQADHGISKELLARGYARLEDAEVDRSHPRSSWKTMDGTAGVVLLEDTRGLHKGMRLLRDHRLMLQFEYAQSLFGHPASLETAAVGQIDDPYWEEMQVAYPRLFDALRR